MGTLEYRRLNAKKAKGDDSSGLIIATFENRDQVSKVLVAKNDL